MKKTITPLAIILFVMAGFGGCKQSGSRNENIIKVDVTASYPKKELILQDFMDVEYIPLETKEGFLNQGFLLDVGKDIILVMNRNGDGDIFVYDRTGKAIRKINHKGQSGEEYINIFKITLDEENGEMFVDDIYAKKIVVYDLYGKFKRSFKHKEGSTYSEIFNFDQKHLICYDRFISDYGEANRQSFMIISKQDGSITKEIEIPFKEKISTAVMLKNEENKVIAYAPIPHFNSITPYEDNWLLAESSSDTIYKYSSGYNMTPFVVRTPSIQSRDPKVLLVLRLVSDRYIFMETIEKVYNFNTNEGFPQSFFMYDKQEKASLGYTIYNSDYSTKKEIYVNSLRPANNEIKWQSIETYQLVEAYEKGELKGRLKEIAATLDEESNPVIMLIKYKK